jgi:hypothetical protein
VKGLGDKTFIYLYVANLVSGCKKVYITPYSGAQPKVMDLQTELWIQAKVATAMKTHFTNFSFVEM